jgi:serine/threonine protein kinase/Flp pilus assembly protein TadD
MTAQSQSKVTISHYRLIEPLGQGSMGEVWLAEDTQLPRQVAVKLLPRHLSENKDAVDRLLREATAAARVDHPGVVTIYEAGLADNRPYLVMQKVEGSTLKERLDGAAMTIEEVVALAHQIADALAEVHALGIVHRDLKPANIIISSRGAKILDFGVASVKDSPSLTGTGEVIGTPLTMSPEQVQGSPADNRSDLWALGVILYEALTGTTPFAGESWSEVANRVLNEQPRAPRELRSEVPTDLDYLVMKLLRKDSAHRYGRAEDLLADLANLERGAGLEDTAVSEATPTPSVAVLYFEVLSSDPEDSFLAAGLTDDLIVDLTRVEGVRVASRADVSRYKDRSVPPRTVGRELTVDYVVLGSIRRAGSRARINAQLVRASDGHSMWIERFDRTIDDLFDLQEEVSKRIVEALQVALQPGEREMLGRAPTRNSEAYSYYLRAGELLDSRSRDGNFRAEELLKNAIELDPEFALAHAALGQCYAGRAGRWWSGVAITEEALSCADRALKLEPDLTEATLVQAMVHRLRGEPRAALELVGPIVAKHSDDREAVELKALCHMVLDEWDQAIGHLERLTERYPEQYTSASYLSSCYEMVGEMEKFRQMREVVRERVLETLRLHPDDAFARSILGINLVEGGEIDEAVRQLKKSVAIDPGDSRNRYNAACAYSRAGRIEESLAELEGVIRNLPDQYQDWPRKDPDLANARRHPDFERIVSRVGTEDAC